jgi:hypothetical protein
LREAVVVKEEEGERSCELFFNWNEGFCGFAECTEEEMVGKKSCVEA